MNAEGDGAFVRPNYENLIQVHQAINRLGVDDVMQNLMPNEINLMSRKMLPSFRALIFLSAILARAWPAAENIIMFVCQGLTLNILSLQVFQLLGWTWVGSMYVLHACSSNSELFGIIIRHVWMTYLGEGQTLPPHAQGARISVYQQPPSNQCPLHVSMSL